MKAVFAAALLGSSSTSCLAFLLPAATRSTAASTRSPAAAAAGGRSLKAHFSSSVGRRGDIGSSSTSRCSGISSSRRVFAGRSCVALGAAEGAGDAGGVGGGSVDIFDALTAGDMAFVTEYVQAGGDCSVQDSIGQQKDRERQTYLCGLLMVGATCRTCKKPLFSNIIYRRFVHRIPTSSSARATSFTAVVLSAAVLRPCRKSCSCR